MSYVYLLTVQGLIKGSGEMYSVIGVYSSEDKAKEARTAAEAIIGSENLFLETETEVHEGAELTIRAVALDTSYQIYRSGDLVTTDFLIGGVIV